jgi:anti-repressor protein
MSEIAQEAVATANVVPFTFEGADIRIIEIDDEPWFVAIDVAKLLGYLQPNNAVRQHCRGCVKHTLPTSSGMQEMTIIPERDVYRLIMRSKLPGAERFEEWVVGTVLPTIRKTGSFGRQHVDPIRVLNDPAAMRGLLLTYSEKVISLEAANAALVPKAQALDRLSAADGSMCITDAAKALQMRPKDLFAWLSMHRWIFRRPGSTWLAYQERIQQGVLEHKVTTVERADGTTKVVEQVLVTAKGLSRLSELVTTSAAVSVPA